MIDSDLETPALHAAASPIARRRATWDATRLRELRYSLALSQAELAAHLNVSRQALKNWEQGMKRPGGAAARLLDLAVEHPAWFLTAHAGTSAADDTPGLLAGTCAANLPAPAHLTAPETALGAETQRGISPHRDTPREELRTERPALEHARTLARVREREYPVWWRERAIIALTSYLQTQVARVGRRYILLSAPCADAPETLDGARRELGPGPFPDLMLIPRAAATAGHWSAITSVRLTIDVLPTSRALGATRSLARWPRVEVMERWTLDPFAHRLTVWRVDAPTRHHTALLKWRIEPLESYHEIAIKPFFLSFTQYPVDWTAALPFGDEPAPRRTTRRYQRPHATG